MIWKGKRHRRPTRPLRYSSERGEGLVSAALLLPLILLIAVVIVDMARLFVTSIYAQELVLLAAKIGASQNPQGYAFPTGQLVEMKSHPAEDSSITNKRRAFWAGQLDPGSPLYYGAPFYSDKDKKVLNLMHGFAHTLSSRVDFPTPYPLNSADPQSEIGFRVNCSMYFRFAPGHEPPNPFPLASDSSYDAVMSLNRDRIYYVECVVPLMSLSLGSFLQPQKARTVTRSAYAARSGALNAT